MTIRRAQRKDINQIATLALDLYKFHSRIDKRYKLKPDAICLRYIKKDLIKYFKKPKGKTILVVEEDGKIVGYADFGVEKRPFNFWEKGAWIWAIHVDKKYRRRSIATALVREAAKILKNKGIKEIDLGYVLKNKESANFWKFLGVKILSVNGIINIKDILKIKLTNKSRYIGNSRRLHLTK